MKQLQIRGVTMLLFFIGASVAMAQVSVNAGSMEASDSNQNIVLSATIGQVFANSSTANNIIELQGVQQPIRFETLSIYPVDDEETTITLYPNPATTHFKLNFSVWNSDYVYSLLDVNGKSIKSGKVLSNNAALQIDSLSEGLYLVTITDNKDFFKTFKLIKK
ncbi:MAG: T9SS type A sorting domain-containing protein [Nonlabens sp.]